jgi:hypothetical protein
LNKIRKRIETTTKLVKNLGYELEDVSVQEFYDFMTGENFSDDTTTLKEVLENEYLMVHELVEISELKKMGRKIDKRVIVDSLKEVIYKAHFFAQEFEMNYALAKKDYSWVRLRLGHHRNVLNDDPNLPEKLKPLAQTIYDKFIKIEKEDLN